MTQPLNLFNCFTTDMMLGKHVIGTDVFKIMLTDTAPDATNTSSTNITEIAAGNGYTASGLTVTLTQSTSSGTNTIATTGATLTATGTIPNFRYLVLYNDTTGGTPVIGWIDNGAEVEMVNTDTFAISFTSNDVMAIAP